MQAHFLIMGYRAAISGNRQQYGQQK